MIEYENSEERDAQRRLHCTLLDDVKEESKIIGKITQDSKRGGNGNSKCEKQDEEGEGKKTQNVIRD